MGVGMKLNWEFDLGEEKLDELALEVDVPEGLANDPGLAEGIEYPEAEHRQAPGLADTAGAEPDAQAERLKAGMNPRQQAFGEAEALKDDPDDLTRLQGYFSRVVRRRAENNALWAAWYEARRWLS